MMQQDMVIYVNVAMGTSGMQGFLVVVWLRTKEKKPDYTLGYIENHEPVAILTY